MSFELNCFTFDPRSGGACLRRCSHYVHWGDTRPPSARGTQSVVGQPKNHITQKRAAIAMVPFMLVVLLMFSLSPSVLGQDSREQKLQMLRNHGVAYYENEDFDLAVPEFEKCTKISENSAADWINLGLAYFKSKAYDNAVSALERARQLDPEYLHSSYALGLVYKKNNMFEEAVEEFEKVIVSDPADAPTHYQLGTLYQKLEQDDKAEEAFRAAVRHNPDHPSAHYYLFKYAKAKKRTDEAKRELKIFSRLQKSIPDKQRNEAAFEKSQYLKPIIPPHQSFIPAGSKTRGSISFHDITETSLLPPLDSPFTDRYKKQLAIEEYESSYVSSVLIPQFSGAARFADIDGDGDLDIYLIRSGLNKVYLNEGTGKFRDATAASGTFVQGTGIGIAIGDFDNDGDLDICVLNSSAKLLLQNDGSGVLVDVTQAAGVGEFGFIQQAVFFDYDHDGDLDLLVGEDRKNVLYRNNGDSTFTVVDESLWADTIPTGTRSIAFGDFDGDDDTDLLLLNEDASPRVCFNMRHGRFVPGEALIGTGAHEGTTADFDNDGDLDVVLVGDDGAFVFQNDGNGRFVAHALPTVSSFVKGDRATALELMDFDNDGLVDLLLATETGKLGLFANVGSCDFSLFSEDLLAAQSNGLTIVSLDVGDIDNDGDLDILGAWSGGVPFLLENRGGESANWLDVEPVGIRVSRQGIGAKLEIKTGPYYQRRDVSEWPVHFGLGTVDRVDVLRITWTNGIVQNMVSVPIRQKYRVKEIVRTDASCPFLFAFDGEKFNYVNDILGVAAMGVPFDEGVYHIPDPDEYVKIKGELLAESDGLYLLRLAAEFKEIVYLDQAKLLVIDHPADVEVYPNERFSEPPFIEPGIHTVKNKHYPIKATDQAGRDILPLIMQEDLKYPSNIPMTAYDGLAKRHWIELDLGNLQNGDRVMLYLTGWIYWSSSSVNVAVSQNEGVVFEAVSLSVPDAEGRWVTVIDDIGLPNGKNSTIPVDLSDKFLSDDYRVRLITNLVVYWDEMFFTVDDAAIEVKQNEAPLLSADLHYRGFSAMTKDSLGMEFFDYDQVERFGPWRQHVGRYTRYGPVVDLLGEADDRYVIYGPGEEISLAYDASEIPALPAGWKRDFFFYAFGWIKDGDPNTVHSETVKPLPFRGMPGYPYQPSVHPRAEEIERNLADYLTREEVETVGLLRK